MVDARVCKSIRSYCAKRVEAAVAVSKGVEGACFVMFFARYSGMG
jgi:hypothetical protein